MRRALLILYLLPFLAFAIPFTGPEGLPDQSGQGYGGGIDSVITTFRYILGLLIPILVTLALIYFIYGMSQYILESGNEAKKVEGKNRMIYGTAALFVIVTIWGLVSFIQKTVGIENPSTPPAPKIMQPR